MAGKGFLAKALKETMKEGKIRELIPEIIYKEALKALGIDKIKEKEKKREWRIA